MFQNCVEKLLGEANNTMKCFRITIHMKGKWEYYNQKIINNNMCNIKFSGVDKILDNSDSCKQAHCFKSGQNNHLTFYHV